MLNLKITDMKHLLFFLVVFCSSLCCNAQRDSLMTNTPIYSVRPGFIHKKQDKVNAELEAFRQNHLNLAGEAMQKSATFMIGSMASSLLSGTCFAIGATTSNGGGKTALLVSGGVTGLASLVCLGFSIHYHDKAGRELRISAGEVVFKF